MKKYIFITFILILLFPLKVILFANDTLDKNGFEIYNQRVKDICEKYNPQKKIFITKNFAKALTPREKEDRKTGKNKIEVSKIILENGNTVNKSEIDGSNAFTFAKIKYEEDMNNIYKCAILNAQISTLNLLKKDILKISENPELSKEVEPDLDNQIKKIELSINNLKCKPISKINDGIQKLNILQQTTFELCRYHTYLEYLREYNSDYQNLTVSSDQTDYNSMYLVNLEKYRKEQIDNEIDHIYKVYPIAFNAYKQYEDNLSTHILLGLIKDDYKVLRDNLHKVLNPINQVVYKISNAMKE